MDQWNVYVYISIHVCVCVCVQVNNTTEQYTLIFYLTSKYLDK